MAFSGKSEQRLALSLNYKGGTSTLQGAGVKGPKDMGDNGPRRIYGAMSITGRNKDGMNRGRLYGSTVTAKGDSGVAGPMSTSGYTSGPKWKRAMEPGELKPGTYAQAKNTTRMTPGKGDKSTVMKTTGTTPKALRGGGRGPR